MGTLRFCKFCGMPFISERYHQKRNHCYNDACIYEFEQEQLKRTRKLSHEHGERQKAERHKKRMKNELCTHCHIRPKMKGNRYLCEVCYKREAGSMFDVDFGFGIDKQIGKNQ